MNEKKTLQYDWQCGWDIRHDEVSLEVNSYLSNNSLYIGLNSRTGDEGEWEPFGAVTVNLPVSDEIPLKVNEAYISDFMSKYLLEFIQKNKLGTILPEKGHSGYCDYAKVAFDMERLREFDPEGVKRYLDQSSRNRTITRESDKVEEGKQQEPTLEVTFYPKSRER
ncbi:MAG: DUF4313 domain-containing protein [Clostridiales bacterium]|nr:DUF4313 domain-containing protein [Clostridiales bacterium]